MAPNFNLLGQSHTSVREREKCGLVTEKSRGLKFILEEEKDIISEINNEEETNENHMTFDHHSLWFYSDIVKDTVLNVGGEIYSHYLPFNRLRHSVFYKNPIHFGVLQKTSFTRKIPFLTFKSHIRVDNKRSDMRFTSPESLSGHLIPGTYLGSLMIFTF